MTNLRKETWKNVTKGVVGYLETDSRGNETSRLVRSGQTFTISTADRILNQDIARRPEKGIFANGVLQPVRIFEDVEDYKEIAANPNFVSETDIAGLLKTPIKTFQAKLAEITSENTLKILAQAAEADPNVKGTHEAAIRERLAEFQPENVIEVTTTGGTAAAKGAARAGRAVTP